ncbi:macrophage mannose receptor 1-like [Gigantopelta aegis]|uniref:macrophage mannose receptor 1-like n=1 Tax=Gigantopelta aegis TaxID=1735272 RepID=UPI001B88AD59|nr:macrophage mannose receptor 1-like [Gigantopelta aegis]
MTSTRVELEKGVAIESMERIAGPCANHNCLSTDICEPTSQSSVQCVTVYCPSIPNVLHAKADFITTYETTKVGSELSYTCDINFHPVGNRTCIPNGTWSDFRCEPDVCPAFCDPSQNKCYSIFYDENKTWTDALATCAVNGSLVDIKTRSDYSFLNKTVRRGEIFWIGLNNINDVDAWTWTDGRTVSYSNWGTSSPDPSKHCVTWDSTSGKYQSRDCNEGHLYICRIYPDCPAPPSVANGAPAYTGQPNTTVGTVLSYTCNTFYEPEGEMRCLAGGIWSNFTCSGGCPTDDGYKLLESPALCFKIVLDKKTYAAARGACIQSGSRLIVLDTPEKNTKIISYFTSHNFVGYYLIGLTDLQTEGVFVWENGDVAEFTKWEPDEPNDGNGDEDCVALKLASQSWVDTLCRGSKKYICEKKP